MKKEIKIILFLKFITSFERPYMIKPVRYVISLVILINAGILPAQEFSYPAIKKEGLSITDFIPKGWAIHDSASGDLNKARLADFAVVLQHKDSITILKRDDIYTDMVLTQPRMLLIVFREQTGYQLVEQSNTFILNHDNANMDDPYRSITIKNGVLQLDFGLFYYSGGWTTNSTSYKFRYQENEFKLIGADDLSFHRATMDSEIQSFNFLNKKWSLTKGNESTGKQSEPEWHSLDMKELKTIKTFVQPYTWKVVKYIYL